MKIGMISLGCAKNLVDSELVLGMFPRKDIVNDIDKADYVFINTCGFIESAKQESINTIIEIAKNKKVIVLGCLVERYYEDLKKLIPEVFLYIRIKDYPNIKEILNNAINRKLENDLCYMNRVLTTSPYFAYVKISDGCNNKCAYCAIPLIRGSYRSRDSKEIIEEIKLLVNKGVKEVVLISQDTTRYGEDINTNISSLLKEIVKIEGIEFLRLLYLYPNDVSKELIETIRDNKVITPYFDIPIQHASNKMLSLMNRRGTKEDLLNLINIIRKEIPKVVLRTTLIVGFPGETKEDFNELKEFIKEAKFDRLGVFTYSHEEDTPAFKMKDLSEKVKKERYEEIMRIQEDISFELGKNRIGDIHKVVLEDLDRGRSFAFAPDDVDGYIFINNFDDKYSEGDIVNVEITDNDCYNLFGVILDK